eukprot:3526202-Pleurochrysis_carterae.AAC.2
MSQHADAMKPFAIYNLQTSSVSFAARENLEWRFVGERSACYASQEGRAVVRIKSLSSRVRCARRGSGRTREAAAGHVANRASTISIRCVVPTRRGAGSHRARL